MAISRHDRYAISVLQDELAHTEGQMGLDHFRFQRRRELQELVTADQSLLSVEPWEYRLVGSPNPFHGGGVHTFLHCTTGAKKMVVGANLGGYLGIHGTCSHIVVHRDHRRNPEHGRRKNGQNLWEAQLEVLKRNGVKKIHIITVGGNIDGLRFWIDGCGCHKMTDALIMERDIRDDENFEACTSAEDLARVVYGSIGVRGLIAEASFAANGTPTREAIRHALMVIKDSGILRVHALVPTTNQRAIETMMEVGFYDIRKNGEQPLQLII